jgi:hypothetical protein
MTALVVGSDSISKLLYLKSTSSKKGIESLNDFCFLISSLISNIKSLSLVILSFSSKSFIFLSNIDLIPIFLASEFLTDDGILSLEGVESLV